MWQIKRFFPCIFLFSFSPVFADEPNLSPFEATYKLYSSGAEIGVVQRTFTESDNNEYIYRSDSHTTGIASVFRKDHIVEESRWKFADNQFYPLDYSYQKKGGKEDRDVSMHFDWDKNIIINRVNDRTRETQLQSGVLDKLLYQYAIMHDLQIGNFPNSYTIVDGGKIKTYNFERLGEETIHTPLGDLHTIKVIRHKPNDKRKSIFWCAPKFQYLPVQVEHTEEDGFVTTAIIQSLSGL